MVTRNRGAIGLGFAAVAIALCLTPLAALAQTGGAGSAFVASSSGHDLDSGNVSSRQAEPLVRGWIDAFANPPAERKLSQMRVYDWKTFRIGAPNNDVHYYNLTLTADIRCVIDRTSYVLPVGGSASQYAVQVVAGIKDGQGWTGFDNANKVQTILWKANSSPWKDFIVVCAKALVFAAAGEGVAIAGVAGGTATEWGAAIGGHAIDTILEAGGFGIEEVDHAEHCDRQQLVHLNGIPLRGNQDYTVYVYAYGMAKTAALGLACGHCCVDFYNPDYHGSDGTKMRGIKLEDYALVQVPQPTAPPPYDPTPPVGSNIRVTGLTDTSATIQWDTDDEAKDKVDWVPVGGTGGTTGYSTVYTRTHSVTLTGLQPNTKYNVATYCKNHSGNGGGTCVTSFTTLPSADQTPPVGSNLHVTGITQTGCTVVWTTDDEAAAKVDYCPDGGNWQTTWWDSNITKSHSVVLTGLTPGTHYTIKVYCHNRWAYGGPGGTVTFTTAGTAPTTTTTTTTTTTDTTPPVATGLKAVNVTNTTATIQWTTDDPAKGKVDWTPAGGSVQTTGYSATYVTAHSVNLTNLQPGKTYTVKVYCQNQTGYGGPCGTITLTTTGTATPVATTATADTTPPVGTGLKAVNVTPTSATIQWTTDDQAKDKVDWMPAGGSWQTTGYSATYVTAHSVNLTNLQPGKTYTVNVYCQNQSGYGGKCGTLTFTTPEAKPDLVIAAADIVHNPAQVIAGHTATVGVTVHNVGFATAANVKVRLMRGTTQIGEKMLTSIAAGGQGSVSFSVAIGAKARADVTVKAVADPLNAVDESNENNNKADHVIGVTPAVY